MKNTEIDHFKDEKPHTAIKHRLFKNVLDTSLSIANGINFSQHKNNSYIYIDLYAGAGKFKDEHKGSPLIALDSFEKYKNEATCSFKNIEMIVAEKNNKNIESLKNNMSEEQLKLGLSNINCKFCEGSWEIHSNEFKSCIKSNQWGFVFVDPFSLELSFKDLLNMINESPYYKDILILINKSAQERVLGKIDAPDIEKVCNYFDISKDSLKRLFQFVRSKNGSNEIVIQHLIKRSLSLLDKDYIINASITRTRNGELEDSDRFYLCLITSSIGVANSFLEKYAEELENKNLIKNNMQLSLLKTSSITKYLSLEDSIEKIFQKDNLTLFELSKKLFNVFLSWKRDEENEIPHRKALLSALNNLISNKKICILNIKEIEEGCVSSKTQKLLAKSLNTKEFAKTIQLGLNR